jgi:hypothetical protein
MSETKIMYVAPRPPGVAAPAFAARWREHAALAIGDDAWRAAATWYEFFDPMTSSVPASLRAPAEIGGVCIVKFTDAAALERRLADPVFSTMLYDDEMHAFGRRLDHDLFPVEEMVILDRGTPRYHVFELIGTADQPSGELPETWNRGHLDALSTLPRNTLPRRVRLNKMPEDAPCAAIAEVGFDSPAAAAEYALAVDGPTTVCFLATSEVLHSTDGA